MFTDGVLYASVAHNLAIGKGTFWFPYFDNYMFTFFHQQPPLTFGIQALFFKAFGDSMYVERAYSFLMACISALLIAGIWRTVNTDNPAFKKMWWLPVLLWISIPTTSFAYINNLEENTMGVFILVSVLCIFKGLQEQKLVLVALGSAFTVLASLCKGFPGLFPIIIPLCYFIITKHNYSFIKALVFSVIAIITPVLIYSLLLTNNNAYTSLSAYLHDRVLHSIQNVSNVESRFDLIEQLFITQLSVPLAIAVLLVLVKGFKEFKFQFNNSTYTKTILLFVTIGISASFPLIITREQRIFYLAPSFPYYAIAIALAVAPIIDSFIQRLDLSSKTYKTFSTVTTCYLWAVLIFTYINVGKYGRDKEKLNDISAVGNAIPAGSYITVSDTTWQDWNLHNYFVRYYNISLDTDTNKHAYYLLDRNIDKKKPTNFKELVLSGQRYNLYKR